MKNFPSKRGSRDSRAREHTRQSRSVSFTSASTFEPPLSTRRFRESAGITWLVERSRTPTNHTRFQATTWTFSDLAVSASMSANVQLSSGIGPIVIAMRGAAAKAKEENTMKHTILICTTAIVSLGMAAMSAHAAPGNTAPLKPEAVPKPQVVYDVASLGNPLGGSYGQGSSITNSGQVAGFD